MGSPALHMHAYEYEAEDFGLELGRDIDVGLLPAPDLHDLQDGYGRTSSNLPALGSAVKALKGWWTEEFTFRGFGIGFVKPIFRGMLIRPDIGVGIRYCTSKLARVGDCLPHATRPVFSRASHYKLVHENHQRC